MSFLKYDIELTKRLEPIWGPNSIAFYLSSISRGKVGGGNHHTLKFIKNSCLTHKMLQRGGQKNEERDQL